MSKRIGGVPTGGSSVKGDAITSSRGRPTVAVAGTGTGNRHPSQKLKASNDDKDGEQLQEDEDAEQEVQADSESEAAELKSGDAESQPSAAEQIAGLQEEMQRRDERHAREMREMKEMMRTIVGESTKRKESSTAHADNGGAGTPAAAGGVVYEQVRRAAVQPDTLRYATASEAGTLEGWIFQLEKMFRQLSIPEAAFTRRLQEAALAWDLDVERWWRMHETNVSAQGKPITTWAGFTAALQAQFVPIADKEAAIAAFFRLQQHGGESMDAYLLRASQLLVRARGAVEDATAARFVVERADETRFPFTLAKVRETMHEQATAASFATIRASLVAAAMREPKHKSTSGTAAGGSSSSSSGSTRGAAGHPRGAGAHIKPPAPANKQVRVAALREAAGRTRSRVGSGRHGGGGRYQAAHGPAAAWCRASRPHMQQVPNTGPRRG